MFFRLPSTEQKQEDVVILRISYCVFIRDTSPDRYEIRNTPSLNVHDFDFGFPASNLGTYLPIPHHGAVVDPHR
jgi:hypothetical protein